MTSASADVIVAGLGAMGSSAAYALARRGLRVLAIDRFAPPHPLGSSHGESRIIREAYFEHPQYVPLVRRAYERWQAMEQESGSSLLRITGGLMIGAPNGTLVHRSRESAERHGIAHELLTAEQTHARFPMFSLPPECLALYEQRAGVLRPEACIQAWIALARRHGADIRTGEPVREWDASSGGVRIATSRSIFEGDRLILAPGAWMAQLVPELAPYLEVERQTMHWFAPVQRQDAPALSGCPIGLIEWSGALAYTFPDLGAGVKIGMHHGGEPTTAESVRRDVTEDDDRTARRMLRRFLPRAAGPLRAHTTCLYTNTPDGHFLIDVHPAHDRVLLVSACSGHGFKFASIIGELVAAMAAGEPRDPDLDPFRWRFQQGSPTTDHRPPTTL